MKKIHAGSGKSQGVLNKGAKPQPATTSGGFHGGTHAVKGVVKKVSTPSSRQPRMATSYHGNVRK
jgi:hypothetical protein